MSKGHIIKGLNLIGEAYFIRLIDNKNCFVHFEGDNPDNPEKEVVYRMKEGSVGACLWHKDKAEAFIKETQQGGSL